MGRREAVAAMRLLARALALRRAPASEWSPDDRITLDAFLRTPTGGRFYDALALLAVTAALRGVEERPFDAIYKGGSCKTPLGCLQERSQNTEDRSQNNSTRCP